MLIHLHVSNYVLIESLKFEPGRNLNTITGETGAGKSILIGALGLILGDRADSKAVAGRKGKCIIEGMFDLTSMDLEELFIRHDLDYATQTIMRREILENGRSRAFINDTPVSLNTLRELGERLVDIHSQHQIHQIADIGFLFHWLDSVCDTHVRYDEYSKLYRGLREKEKALSDLKELAQKEDAQADYNNFLWEELDKADLNVNELNKLEVESDLLQNAEEIGVVISEVQGRLLESDQAMVDELRLFARQLHKLAPSGSELADIASRMQASAIELDDLVNELKNVGNTIQTDTGRLQAINDRLQLLNQLLSKHRVNTVGELIAIRDRLSDNLYESASRKDEIQMMENKVEETKSLAHVQASELHGYRVQAVVSVMESMNLELVKLGLPNARVVLQISESPALNSHGKTVFQMMFSSNKGQALQPAHAVASGGELSRLMLIIKAQMAKKRKLPSIIFDEIDTGVSGEIALRMADVMSELSTDLQVIAITHLPQIAARGEKHFFVYKEDGLLETKTLLMPLEGENRIREIAKMLSGDDPTSGALINARQLLEG